MRGQVRTASGFHRHRSVDAPLASQALEWVLEAAGPALSVVHCCAADAPVSLFRGAGADAVSVDLGVLAASSYDDLATVLDEGGQAWLGVVPTTSEHAPTTNAALDRTRRLLDMLGYDPEEVADRLVLTPACGLAGATPAYALAALRAVREAAVELAG